MPLESGNFIGDLVITNPPGTDLLSESDDHHRLIKRCLEGSFPNAGQQVLDSTFDEIDAIVQGGIKNNYAAIIAPTVDDDSGAGYAVGSRWVDTVLGILHVCVDATVGAAVWILSAPAPTGPDFETGDIVGRASGADTVAHGLDGRPRMIQLTARFLSAQFGYQIDDECMIEQTSSTEGQVISVDDTNCYVAQGSSSNFAVIDRGGGTNQQIPRSAVVLIGRVSL